MVAEDLLPARSDARRERRRESRSASDLVLVTIIGLLIQVTGAELLATSLENALAGDIRRARQRATKVAAHVVEQQSGRTVYESAADRPMVVASNVKLVTTAAALDQLGPGYMLDTEVLLRGRLVNGVLEGDMAVVGSGDPTISGRFFEGEPLAVFRRWAASLRELGVREIVGDLFLVHGLFDQELVHRDWPRDQLARWYEAPVAALSFSDNCLLIRIVPGPERRTPAMVQVIPDLDLVRIDAQVETTGSLRRHSVAVDREPGSDIIQVSGRVWQSSPPVDVWVTVEDPLQYFGLALIRALAEAGLAGPHDIRTVETLPAGPWRPALSHRSDLLSVIEVVNRRSQNFFAESLLKLLGARQCQSGSWTGGLAVLTDFLQRIGIVDGFQLVDGSGMSRNNFFSARQMTHLLKEMAEHRWNREFVESLPHSGYEEHHRWRNRLSRAPYSGRVVAKTGSLRGVSTISGYAEALSGRRYVFSLLFNGADSIQGARRAQDRFLRTLIDRG